MSDSATPNTSIALGDKLPSITLPMTGGKDFHANDFIGKNLVIYFYPKDATPGCTIQGNDFTAAMAAFSAANCVVIGVSRDSIRKHENFITKQKFNFELISDVDETLCGRFDVIKMKKLYGKEYMGIDRSTFLFDTDHILVKEWRSVKVKGHIGEVLQAVQALS